MGSRREKARGDPHLLSGQQRGKRLGCKEMRKESATAETLTESSPEQLSIKLLGCLLGFADLTV